MKCGFYHLSFLFVDKKLNIPFFVFTVVACRYKLASEQLSFCLCQNSPKVYSIFLFHINADDTHKYMHTYTYKYMCTTYRCVGMIWKSHLFAIYYCLCDSFVRSLGHLSVWAINFKAIKLKTTKNQKRSEQQPNKQAEQTAHSYIMQLLESCFAIWFFKVCTRVCVMYVYGCVCVRYSWVKHMWNMNANKICNNFKMICYVDNNLTLCPSMCVCVWVAHVWAIIFTEAYKTTSTSLK